jgi:hypothetical protein
MGRVAEWVVLLRYKLKWGKNIRARSLAMWCGNAVCDAIELLGNFDSQG